jgi:hypothetical protein
MYEGIGNSLFSIWNIATTLFRLYISIFIEMVLKWIIYFTIRLENRINIELQREIFSIERRDKRRQLCQTKSEIYYTYVEREREKSYCNSEKFFQLELQKLHIIICIPQMHVLIYLNFVRYWRKRTESRTSSSLLKYVALKRSTRDQKIYKRERWKRREKLDQEIFKTWIN